MAHEATTVLPLEALDRTNARGQLERAELVLATAKAPAQGILSIAWVHFRRDAKCTTRDFVYDFFERVVYNAVTRATQKAIFEQHGRVFTADSIAEITTKVMAFYEAKAKSAH